MTGTYGNTSSISGTLTRDTERSFSLVSNCYRTADISTLTFYIYVGQGQSALTWNDNIIGTLPIEFRPLQDMTMIGICVGSNNLPYPIYIHIYSNGNVAAQLNGTTPLNQIMLTAAYGV